MADNAMTLFGGEGNALISSDLFKSLMETTKALAGGGAGGKRISLRGKRFRMMDNGEQVMVAKGNEIDIVIVNAAKISRMFYAGAWDPENPSPPTCWSNDTQAPADGVPDDQKQGSRCADCAMNVKGSGERDSRACRFQQRLAITIPGRMDEVYQLQLPATSLFGEAEGGHRPMQAYAKFLASQNAPAIAIVTTMYFDDESDQPKVYFKAKRPLTDEELQEAIKARDSDAAINAITLTVSQTDRVEKKAATTKKADPEPAKKPAAAKKPDPVPEVEDVEEPKKRTSAKTVDKTEDSKPLADLISQWDDE